jgi:hypothetical protein
VLLAALGDPATADSWFPEPLPQFEGWFRFTLLEALIQRASTFEEVLPAALAIVRITSAYTVDREWGPLLVKAFPDGYVPGTELTDAQRSFLQALSENHNCWGRIANPRIWLKRTGLPEERTGIRASWSDRRLQSSGVRHPQGCADDGNRIRAGSLGKRSGQARTPEQPTATFAIAGFATSRKTSAHAAMRAGRADGVRQNWKFCTRRIVDLCGD